MKKEEWINSLLETASEVKEVEPNPYLYHKILNKLEYQPTGEAVSTIKFKLVWVAAIFLIISINVSAVIIYKSKVISQNKDAAIESMANEMNACQTYNY
jgi:hypothetical protein